MRSPIWWRGIATSSLKLSHDGSEAVAFAGAEGKALDEALQEIATNPAAADLPDRTRRLWRPFSHRHRRPRGAAAGDAPSVRVRIYGPLEARLQDVDRVVLGGLVEGIWPPETRSDPWLSRPMRHALGLDLPERRISLSAHDFAQMLGAREVILTHRGQARRRADGDVALRAAARRGRGRSRWERRARRGDRYLAWARALDQSGAATRRIDKPAPKPPRAARPTSLSVTEIENWLRDPYTIYAKHILDLRELDAVDLPPGAADRGTVIHGAIGEFTQTFAAALPADPDARADRARRAALRRARGLSRGARVLVAALPAHRALVRRLGARAARRLAALHAEISRRDRNPARRARVHAVARAPTASSSVRDGGYAILDYKTGTVPTEQAGAHRRLRRSSRSKPRSCAAAAFATSPAGARSRELVYVVAQGRRAARASTKPIDFKDGDADAHADRALAKLTEVAHAVRGRAATPYRSLVLPMWKNALRRLRPSRARQGMVGRRRRRRRGRGE